MSAIHARIAAAKARAAKVEKEAAPQPQVPQGPQTLRPPLPQKPIEALQTWQPTRSRGRPRKMITKEHLSLPPLELFVRECLIENPDAAEFVGSTHKRSVKTAAGGTVSALPTYHRITLAQAFIEFCKDRGYVPVVPRSFPSLLTATCIAAGWTVYEAKTSEWRRRILRGVCLRNQTVWHGDDRNMGRPDRRRWEKKAAS